MLLLLLLIACTQPLVEGEVVEEVWGMRASLVDEVLEVPCADLRGGDGPYDVLLDDATGTTVLLEADRAWIRGPFGLVSDRCWWLPEAEATEAAPEELDCVRRGLQDGQCGPDGDWPEGWVFTTPGAVELPEWTDAVALDGTLILAHLEVHLRLDLTPSHHEPLVPEEGARTYRSWLPYRVTPWSTHATALGALLWSWDNESRDLWNVDRHADFEVEGPYNDTVIPTPGVMGGARVNVALANDTDVGIQYLDWRKGTTRFRTWRHGIEAPPLDAAVHPDQGEGWFLFPDQVLSYGESHARWPVPGAQGLLLGRPGNEPLPYAWGNVDGAGVLYRLEPEGRARAWHLDEPLLGAGIGEDFQELVLVTEGPDGPHVTGWLDRAHVEALAPGTVGLALAVFAETPRDEDYASEVEAAALADDLDLCEGLAGEELVCCVHGERAERLEHNLAWLGRRLEEGGGAAVLGINPTAVAQSTRCGDGAYPEAAGQWLLEHPGLASAALFVHSAPYTPEAWWVRCPGGDPADISESCWNVQVNDASFADFYETLSDAAALAPWIGEEPDWRLVGGGYEGGSVEGVVGWTQRFPAMDLPDGAPAEDGLYFGLAAMDPRVSSVAAKELAPLDARLRPFPVGIGRPPGSWISGNTDHVYWPGQSFAAARVHELGRSGLRFAEWAATADREADWTTEQYPGEEDPEVMTRADFLAMEHLVVTRALAHRDPESARWWTLHLQNLASLRSDPLDEGSMDCAGSCEGDSELDRFMERLETWGGIVTWTPLPP